MSPDSIIQQGLPGRSNNTLLWKGLSSSQVATRHTLNHDSH